MEKITLENYYKNLCEESLPDIDYFFMLLLSSIICFLGFKTNSIPVIIGAMIICPILYSIIGVAASIFFKDFKQLIKELRSLLLEISLILIFIFLLGKLFEINISTEITTRLKTSITDYFLIAFFSGIGGTFSLFWPKIKQSLTGIAIAVALIPPIVLCGIGLAKANPEIITISTNIVLINLLGIILGSLVCLFFLKIKNAK